MLEQFRLAREKVAGLSALGPVWRVVVALVCGLAVCAFAITVVQYWHL